MSERFKVTVLKTVEVNSSVGSNPTLSATLFAARWIDQRFGEVLKRLKRTVC